MATLNIERERCKSCEFCVVSCPKGALMVSEQLNSGGYHYVDVDMGICNACGICYIVCPDGVFEIKE